MRVLLSAIVALLILAAPASAASPDVVISQVYGGGGNQGATLTNDFIELHNRGTAAVPLDGWSVQYASSAGTSYQVTPLSGSIAPGRHYLVHEAAGAGGSQPLPQPNATGSIPMSATSGKVALVTSAVALTCGADCDAAPGVRDFIGYGGANDFETAAAPGLSNTTAAIRNAGADTDNNAADFAAGPPNPRNTPPAVEIAASDPADGENDVPLAANVSVTFSAPVVPTFGISCSLSGAHPFTASGGPTVFVLDPASDFARGETCTVTVEAHGLDDEFSFTTLGLELRIREIQGSQHVSPHLDALVSNVPGVVTARRGNGFFFQDPEPDDDPDTPEGLFVFTGSTPQVAVGSAVNVSGRVVEFRQNNRPADLTLTEITGATVTPLDGGADIEPTVIGEGGRVPPGRIIDNDSVVDVEVDSLFDPAEDGIDFYESLEGMLVRVEEPLAVGPRAAPNIGELPVVADGGRFAGPRTARGGLIIEPDDFNPERMHLDDEVLKTLPATMPEADVRDGLGPVEAVVDYSFSNFKLQVTSAPEVIDGGLEKEVTEPPGRHELSVGSFNVENLTPLGPNPSPAQRAKYEALAETLVERMQAPDIVGVEEVQDNNGTSGGTNSPVTDASQTWESLIDAIEAAGGPTYDYRQIDPVAHQDGGAPGGNIRVGFLFRTDRGLEFVDRPGGTSTNATGVVDTRHGPQLTLSPGRIEPADPAWTASRKPLAGEFRWRGRTVIAVVNHFASKGGDDPLFGRFQPPVRHTEIGPDGRHRQAALVNEFVRDVLAADHQARVIVLGDINDFEFSETVEILEQDGALTSLFDLLPKEERYSYVFEGNSQVLDQILVSDSLLSPRPEYDSVHMNAEFADQTSDHDPQVARLRVTGRNDAAHAFGDQ